MKNDVKNHHPQKF